MKTDWQILKIVIHLPLSDLGLHCSPRNICQKHRINNVLLCTFYFLLTQVIVDIAFLVALFEPRHEKICLWGFQFVQPQKMARGLKFQI